MTSQTHANTPPILDGATLLAPGGPELPPPDLSRAVENALPLLPPSTGGIVVLVNDPQRHTATNAVLRLVAERISPSRLRVLVAAGSHPAPPRAARELFERSILGGIAPAAIRWHDCRAAGLVPIGQAAPGRAAWRGHPWLLESAGVLAIGSVEPHYFAGWTGAHKTATVGLAAHDDIQANHALALSPRCRPTCLDGNPVAEGILAMLGALEAARPVAAVNLVQAGPDILAAAGGSARAALDAARPPAEAAFVRRIDKPADALIAEVAGPLAESFYQADKGIKNNEWAVRDGGCLILAAACPQGMGQDHFVRLLRRAATHAEAVSAVESAGYRLGDHKAVRLRYLTDPACRAVRVYVVSEGLSPADAALLGLRKAPTVAAALADAAIRPGRDSVLHVRDAGNLCVMPN
jgi:nickel-dependent lactate racemase